MNWFKGAGHHRLLAANAAGDDIIVYADDGRTQAIATFHTQRQQLEKRESRFNAPC